MTSWSSALLRVHLMCALGAMALFWIAAVTSKGGRRHRAAGRWFSRLIYAAAVTGGLLAVIQLIAPSLVRPADPTLAAEVVAAARQQTRQTMWLVLYVLLLIVTPVQHGLAVVAAGPAPPRMRSRPHATLSLLSMIGSVLLLPAAVMWQQPFYLALVPIGFIVGLRNLSYAARPQATPVEWEREHLTSLITAGIGLHTTFLVFGTSRTLGWRLEGWSGWLPWIGPAVVGVPVILWLRSRRRAGSSARPTTCA